MVLEHVLGAGAAAASRGAGAGIVVPLDRLPDALLLRVPDATWRVADGWPVGLFPLQPVHEPVPLVVYQNPPPLP